MIELKEKTALQESCKPLFKESESSMQKILGIGEELRKGDYFQQGDCILAQVGDENFKDAPTKISGELQKSNLILKGVNNSHALYEGDFEIYRDDSLLFVKVNTYTVLSHVRDLQSNAWAEHHAQYIPKGEYFLRGILEFDHLEKMARQVID